MNLYGGYQGAGPYPAARIPQDHGAAPASGLDIPPRRSTGADSAREDFLYAPEDDPDEIVTEAPREKFRLGYVDGICLVINRMIGTGIFRSPGRALSETRSVGVTLLFWFFGMFYSMSGAHVYVEYGLNIPRYIIDGVEQSVPRSGGDLNYLQYVYRKPRYRRETVIYLGVVFGISFICLGNMAGNCINFAVSVLTAASPDQNYTESQVRGIALVMATFACFIHFFSRRGGILLNDVLAITKIAILLLFVVSSIVVAGGGWKYRDGDSTETVQNQFPKNTKPYNAFAHHTTDPAGYSRGFLAVLFAITGFDQPNYVLGEIDKPRRRFPITMFTSVGLVSVVYMMTNIAYMVVVDKSSKDALSQTDDDVPLAFLKSTFGHFGSNVGHRMYYAFLAISSTGNIIVMTFTASRMKQEIAKEGFLPYSSFFAQSRDWSLGRILSWLRRRGKFNWITRWLVPENHTEKTPVGALLLHLLSCFVLISITWGMKADHAYELLAGFIAYQLAAFFGVFLALGILLLRFRGPPETAPPEADNSGLMRQAKSGKMTWKQMSEGTVNPTLSVVTATIFLIGNLYPLAANWIPPNMDGYEGLMPWYLVPLLSFCVLGLGSLWWVGFIGFAKRREKKRNLFFVAERKLQFKFDGLNDEPPPPTAEARKGRMILLHETVYLSWQDKETKRMQMEQATNGPSLPGFPQDPRDGAQKQQQEAAPVAYDNFEHLGL